jgi:DNA repair exonuclease SbcCD ATPase subunit
MDWATWFKLIGISAASGAAAASAAFKLFGDYWLAKRKAEYDKEIEKLKAQNAQDLEQYRAKLNRSNAAIKEVSQCLSEVNVLFRKLHPIDASIQLTTAETTQYIDELQKASDRFNAKLQEWSVFLEPDIYDAFERCHTAADSEWRRLKTRSGETDRAGTVNYFWTSYRQASQLVRDLK